MPSSLSSSIRRQARRTARAPVWRGPPHAAGQAQGEVRGVAVGQRLGLGLAAARALDLRALADGARARREEEEAHQMRKEPSIMVHGLI